MKILLLITITLSLLSCTPCIKYPVIVESVTDYGISNDPRYSLIVFPIKNDIGLFNSGNYEILSNIRRNVGDTIK